MDHFTGLCVCNQSGAVTEQFFTLTTAPHHSQAKFTRAQMTIKHGRNAEALHWATLASVQGDCTDGKVELILAQLYHHEYVEGIPRYCGRSLYWENKEAMAGEKYTFFLLQTQ